jgi:hypothetical protein
MRLTEEEKKEILSKYQDNTSDELLTHLKRTYHIFSEKLDWMDAPIKYINIDGKTRMLTNHKKNMVNRIYSLEEDRWISLGKEVIRRTIKKFIDGNLIDTN